jgi:23S rRNA (cytidine2498-2'-O)-methyltransferase
MIQDFQGTAYLAPEGFLKELSSELSELTSIQETHDRLILTPSPPQKAVWAQNTWLNPVLISFESISDAAKALRSIQGTWVLTPTQLHRRAALIQEKLPKIKFKPISFPSALPETPLGSWTLLEKNLILASPSCSSPFPNGEIHFKENKTDPPSRAYLKLWEALCLSQKFPKKGELCLDFGSSPGSWSWALHELGANVVSVDRAALEPKIQKLPRIEFLKKDAFKISPEEIGPLDWFCSDIICYPERLLELVHQWLDAKLCQNFICTLKFQGETDHHVVNEFKKIPHSNVQHLFHNKHELTWSRLQP